MPTKDPIRTAEAFRFTYKDPVAAANTILERKFISPELRKHYEEVVRILKRMAKVDGKPPAPH